MTRRGRHMVRMLVWLAALTFVACNKQEKGIDLSALHFRIESPYGTHYITDFPVPFRAIDDKGNDITPSVRFWVDGRPVDSAVYVFSQPGNYAVTALWDLGGGLTKAADDTLHASVIAPRHTSHVLIEDFTGTWCVNCPRVIYHLEEVLRQTDRVVPVSIHNRGYNEDPFHFDGVDTLARAYGIQAYPTPLMERRQVWDERMESIREALNRPRPLGLRMHISLAGDRLDLQVDVRFDMDMPEDSLRLVVYALENGLRADQANATDYYGGENPLRNFEHNHVLRHAFTSVLGRPVPARLQHFDSIYRWHYQGPLPAAIHDPARTEFVAFVIKGGRKGRVVNSQKTKVNETSNY